MNLLVNLSEILNVLFDKNSRNSNVEKLIKNVICFGNNVETLMFSLETHLMLPTY